MRHPAWLYRTSCNTGDTALAALLLVALGLLPALHSAERSSGKHLIIASGQSNSSNFKAQKFKPYLDEVLGADNYILVHRGKGGTSIQAWYKQWTLPEGYSRKPKGIVKKPGEIYDALLSDVNAAIRNKPLVSITFIWMQGESDALGGMDGRYAESLQGLYQQLNTDLADQIATLRRPHIGVVIGRISDFGLQSKRIKEHWGRVRDIQVAFANQMDHATWINTDDCNEGTLKGKTVENDLHFTEEGKEKFRKRFAEQIAALAITGKPKAADSKQEH